MIQSKEMSRSYRYLAILALALVAYWPTFHVGFLWDDHVMIEANPGLREWTSQTLKHDFTTDVFDGHGDPYYRPGQTLLNRLDFALWGLKPFGYHLTNWMGHALNALLLQELVLLLGFSSLTALLVGCLFAVNPIPVEQLMIIAGRAELFSFTFILVSLCLLLQEEAPWVNACGYLAFVIALFFKESSLITPLLLANLFAYERRPWSAYKKLIPFFILCIPYLWLRHHAVGALVPVWKITYALLFFVKAFTKVLLIYVRLICIPWNLHSHRMMPHLSHAWPLLLGVALGGIAYLIKKKSRLGLLSVGWFITALLPKTPIMMYGNFMLDHWAYPASFGLFLPMAVGYERLWKSRQSPMRYGLGLTLFPILIFWALLVSLNVELRGTDEKMYRWALHFTDSAPIKSNLGILLLKTNRAAEAIPYLAEVQGRYPEDANNSRALALAYASRRRPH